MVVSSLDWAFNSPEESDMMVVLTTETAEQYRSRRRAQASQPECRPPTRPKHVPSPAQGALSSGSDTPVVEELYGHKLVLKSHSDFFKAAVNWGSGAGTTSDTASGSSGSRKRSREEPEVAVVSLRDEQQFSTAKLMIRFMYSQKLQDSMDRSEVMRLMLLADEFSVPNLRHACMAHLSGTALKQWSVEERQLLCNCWAPVSVDSLADDELAVAATLLADSFASHFTELEVVLAGDGSWTLLCSLPPAIISLILRNGALVVRSENTVLVAALSWLRTAGKDCTEAVRQEVMQQVRLLQLSPWFFAWFTFHAPEARALLPPGALTMLVRYGHASTAVKMALAEGSAFLRHCATAREGVQPGLTGGLEFSVEGQELRDGVAKCLAHHAADAGGVRCEDCETVWRSSQKLFNGVYWKARVDVSWDDGAAELVVGLCPSLKIGAEVVRCSDDEGILNYDFDFTVNWSNDAVPVRVQTVNGQVLGLTHGISLFSIRPDADDLHAVVDSHLQGGRLVLKFDVLE